ncbi:FGGY-family carbohydrate kinase [Streptomyces sioyaensis]|uniref:FGGY-family carbohydrate kinase n=1 Tax=Streptomyces sioyaensis TaxID=67364 RepID=UPI0037D4E1A3
MNSNTGTALGSDGTLSHDLALGIDVGTTSVKTAVFTAGGTLLRAYASSHPTSRPRPGHAEQDPADWWDSCLRGIATVLDGVPTGAVRSVGVVSQVNTHVFTDSRLRPLAPAITWQDQRCAGVARQLDGRFTAEEKIRIFGGPITLDASRLVSRAAWFADHHPDLWARTRWVLSPKDWVNARLTGEVTTDGLSSIGMVNGAGDQYVPAAVSLVDGLAERLPPLADPAAPVGPVTAPVPHIGAATAVTGTMDAFGTVFGSGTTEPGRALLSCGTSLVVAGASRQSCPNRGVVTFPPVHGLYLHGGPTQAGGDALTWWSRTRSMNVPDVLTTAATAPPGSSGVVFTPHLLGERAPLWDPAVRGTFLGLSAASTSADLARAVLEGVAMSGRQVLTAVEAACGARLDTLTLSGGGSRSDLWAQIFADVLRRPVARLAARDNAAVLGAALLGAVGAGFHPDITTAARTAATVDRVFTPEPARAELLDPLYAVYTTSYEALRDIHTHLDTWRTAQAVIHCQATGHESSPNR